MYLDMGEHLCSSQSNANFPDDVVSNVLVERYELFCPIEKDDRAASSNGRQLRNSHIV